MESFEGRLQVETMLHKREEGLRQEEALKQERVEAEARKATEDHREAREFADAAKTTRVLAEGDAEILQAEVGEVR